MTYLADVGALARKDLTLELRARDTLPAMLLFVLSTLVVFHFVLPSDSSELAAKGLLWVAIVFTALLGLSRAFAAEREQGLIDGLVLATRDRSAIWLGKALSMLSFLALAEVVALPAFALFFTDVGGGTIAGVILAVVALVVAGVIALVLSGRTTHGHGTGLGPPARGAGALVRKRAAAWVAGAHSSLPVATAACP